MDSINNLEKFLAKIHSGQTCLGMVISLSDSTVSELAGKDTNRILSRFSDMPSCKRDTLLWERPIWHGTNLRRHPKVRAVPAT